MLNPEINRKTVGRLDDSMSIEKEPTTLDLILILQMWKKEPADSAPFITIVAENSRGIHFEVIDDKRGNEILNELGKLYFPAKLCGEVIIHNSPKG